MIEYLLLGTFLNFVFQVGTGERLRAGLEQTCRGRIAVGTAGGDESREQRDQTFIGLRPEVLFQT
jgi:hypothetical protein